jgi:toxin ParE1/3/4
LQIFWTLPAERDLDHIENYISKDNSVAAVAVVLEIISTAETLLPEHPHIGKPGRIHGTRELVVPEYPSYILIYRAKGGALEILRVLHAARKWPDESQPKS